MQRCWDTVFSKKIPVPIHVVGGEYPRGVDREIISKWLLSNLDNDLDPDNIIFCVKVYGLCVKTTYIFNNIK